MFIDAKPIDLQQKKLTDFAKDKFRKPGDFIEIPADSIIEDWGGVRSDKKSDPVFVGQLPIRTSIRRQYQILKNGQSIGDHHVLIPVVTTVKISRHAVLAFKKNIAQEIIDAVKVKFLEYDFYRSGNLDVYISQKLAEYNSTASKKIESDEFAIFFDDSFKLVGFEEDLSQENWLHEIFYGRGLDFVHGFIKESNLRSDGYEIRRVGEVYISDLPPHFERQELIKIPKGGLPSADIELLVDEIAVQLSKKSECNPGQPIKEKIFELELWPEFKYEPAWLYYKNSCGGGFHFFALKTYSRTAKRVLYATATFPTLEESFRSIFLESLKEAASLAAVTGVVFSSYDVAKETFKSHFWILIKARVLRAVNCLLPDLIVAEESSEWVEGSFQLKKP